MEGKRRLEQSKILTKLTLSSVLVEEMIASARATAMWSLLLSTRCGTWDQLSLLQAECEVLCESLQEAEDNCLEILDALCGRRQVGIE